MTSHVTELDFTEDPADALLILLNLAHHRSKKVPRGEMKYELLLNMATLCEQYDTLALVDPYIKNWAAQARWDLEKHFEGYIFISYVFGDECYFSWASGDLTMILSFANDEFVSSRNGITHKIDDKLLPPGAKGT